MIALVLAALPSSAGAEPLRWGADAQGGAPFVFQDPVDPNHLIGFEVDLADALGSELGRPAIPVQGQWENLLSLLARGDFDVALNGIEVAEEKLRVCRLSEVYYVAAERLTVRANDAHAPSSLAELKGRKVGTLPGSVAARILERAGADVRTYEGGQNEIYEDLRLGRTDAVLLDDTITRYYGAIHADLRIVDGAFGAVSYAAAVRTDDKELLRHLNEALGRLRARGELQRIYEHWGLWNPETAVLFGVPFESPTVSPAYEHWRAAVGELPPFWTRVRERYPATISVFARGAALTLGVSVCAMALAVLLGFVLALSRWKGPAPLRLAAVLYIEFFRGTPLLVQLTMIYFGLPELGVKLAPFVSGVLALGLNYAAAEAENYRAGLESVPPGQLEAAQALGLSSWQVLRLVVGPQAIRVAIPPVTNDFIALLKDSSLVSLVTLTELTKTYVTLANSMRDHLGLGLMVALWYLLIGLPVARLARLAELKLGAHLRR